MFVRFLNSEMFDMDYIDIDVDQNTETAMAIDAWLKANDYKDYYFVVNRQLWLPLRDGNFIVKDAKDDYSFLNDELCMVCKGDGDVYKLLMQSPEILDPITIKYGYKIRYEDGGVWSAIDCTN